MRSISAQLRALMYVSTLTSEIMDSMVAVESAVEGALERQTTFRASLHWRKKTAVYQRCAVCLLHALIYQEGEVRRRHAVICPLQHDCGIARLEPTSETRTHCMVT